MSHISTSYWVPAVKDGKPTGILNYHSQKPMREVRKQIESVLEATCDSDNVPAAKIMEWLTTEPKDDELCPKGEPFAVMRQGASEGYLAEIFVMARNENTARRCVTIKFLSGKSFVYEVVRALNEACSEGGFANDHPPQ